MTTGPGICRESQGNPLGLQGCVLVGPIARPRSDYRKEATREVSWLLLTAAGLAEVLGVA